MNNNTAAVDRNLILNCIAKSLEKDIGEISENDNFFKMGGDSMRAIELVYTINEVCGVKIPLVVLFSKNTIGEIINEIDSELSASVESTL